MAPRNTADLKYLLYVWGYGKHSKLGNVSGTLGESRHDKKPNLGIPRLQYAQLAVGSATHILSLDVTTHQLLVQDT